MGKDKAVSTGTRAHDEPSCTQQDCCGAARSLGKDEGTAKEGSLDTERPSKKKESGKLPVSRQNSKRGSKGGCSRNAPSVVRLVRAQQDTECWSLRPQKTQLRAATNSDVVLNILDLRRSVVSVVQTAQSRARKDPSHYR
jgi:hypothetical protein